MSAEINPELTAALQLAVELVEDEKCGLRDYKHADEFLKKAKKALANRSARYACTKTEHRWECECRMCNGSFERIAILKEECVHPEEKVAYIVEDNVQWCSACGAYRIELHSSLGPIGHFDEWIVPRMETK